MKNIVTSWCLMSLLCILQFTLQGSVGIFAQGMKESLKLDAAAIGFLSSSFFYAYLAAQVPVGMIYDRFGIRNIASGATILIALSCLLLSFAQSLEVAILYRLLMGFACAFGFIGVLTGIKQWFPPQSFAFVTSLTETLALLGVALMNTALSKLVIAYSWRVALVVCAILAALLGLSLRAFVKRGVPVEAFEAPAPFWVSFRLLLTSKKIWLSGLYGFGVFCVMSIFAALWGIPYLMRCYGLDLVTATSVVSMVYVGAALSSPLYGCLVGFIRCSSFMVLGASLTLLTVLLLFYGPTLSLTGLYIVTFLIGFFCSAYQLGFTIVSRSVPRRVQATAMGLTNMIVMMGALLFQPLVGLILSYSADGAVMDGFEVYSASAYEKAMSIIPLLLAISVLLAYWLAEEGTVPLRRWIWQKIRHASRATLVTPERHRKF
ncbi:MAG: MFS transporter [Deltaproteobacteria bacterium]|nr:MFS transporter [Deltaproteobacteria bacterium]